MDGGGLAGPVRPEEAVDLTRSDRDVDPVDSSRALLVLADEAFDLDPVVRRHQVNVTGATMRGRSRGVTDGVVARRRRLRGALLMIPFMALPQQTLDPETLTWRRTVTRAPDT